MLNTARASRRTLLTAGVAAAVLAGGGVAFAYWTTSGSGSGTAAVATSTQKLTLHATTTGLLTPGGSVPVSFTADNASAASLRITSVHLDAVAADSAHSGCTVADFSMADVPENQTIPANGSGVALAGSGTLAYADTAVDQSACMGATLTLTVSSK